MAAADQYRDLGEEHFEMRIGTRDAFGHSINAGGTDGGDWFSAYSSAVTRGYSGGAAEFNKSYYNQLYSEEYNGTMSFQAHTFTHSNYVDKNGEATVVSTRHDFTIESIYIGMSGMGMNALSYAAKNSAAYTPKYAYSGMAQAEAAAAKLLGKIAKVTRFAGTTANVLTTAYSGYLVLGQIQNRLPINALNVADFGIGTLGIGSSTLLLLGLVTNPVGISVLGFVATGAAIYGGVRLGIDLYNEGF